VYSAIEENAVSKKKEKRETQVYQAQGDIPRRKKDDFKAKIANS